MAEYQLIVPAGLTRRRPLLVEVPHAGLLVPEDIADDYLPPREAKMRDADIYVDQLCVNAPEHGAALLTATLSRYVVDLNRAPDDVDAAAVPDHPSPVASQPRGVVWRATTDGRPVLKRPLRYENFLERLARYYTPYHRALRGQLDALHAEFGYAIVLAVHSMPSTARSLQPDPGARRADVVPGTLGRTSADARVIDLVDAHFRHAGLSVRHDDPYRGGFTTAHYGQPHQGVHAIQLEINRALYVDEATCELREPGFTELRGLLERLFDELGSLSLL
jgi:N-formylglutamate amidohydrolase